MTNSTQGFQDRINGLLNTDATSMVPGASDLQTQAFQQAQGLTDRAPMTAQQATSRGILDVDLEGYQNPFQQQVIDTTLAGYDEQSAMKAAQLAAQQAQGQKFSGSGSAIERALFNRGVVQDRAGTEAGLRSSGFDRATGLATGDLNREAETSRFNAQAANQMLLSEREAQLQDIGLLSGLGGQQRDIEREQLGAEPELLKLIAALNSSQRYDLFKGGTTVGNETSNSTTKTSDPLGTLSGILAGAGSAASGLGALGVTFSDERLKEDIETVGKDASGRRLVAYRYKGEPKAVSRIGHIAQEVRKTDPHAVTKIGKHYAIDYGLLGEVA